MSEMQFTRVETGDMTEIPPDAPEGAWVARFKTKIKPTAKDGYPMVIVEAHLEEAMTEGNEAHVGSRVAEFITFFPVGHIAMKMSRMRLKTFCEALKIDVPRFTSIEKASDLAEFCEAIEANKAQVWTKHQVDKTTGETRTLLAFEPPKGSAQYSNDEETPARRKKVARR